MKSIKIISIILAAILVPLMLLAQEEMRTNPADWSDAKTLLINPAIAPYQNLAFNFGMKILQYGFLPDDATGLRHTYNTNTYPNFLIDGLGIGVTFQNFSSPFHSKTGIGLSFGYLFTDAFSFGVGARMHNFSYDEDQFNLVNRDDPVFANGTGQWNLSLDAGFMITPSDKFGLGISFNNINRPDMSLINSGAKLPIEFNFGAKYYIKSFALSLFSNYTDEKFDLGILGEVDLFEKVMFRAGYVEKGLSFESQFKIYRGFCVNYRMDYPLNEVNSFSNGSHQLGVSWNMRYNPMYAYNVKASIDTVRVISEKNVFRIRREVVTDSILSILDWDDLKFPTNDDFEKGTPAENAGLPLDEMENESLPHNKYLESYGNNFGEIEKYMKLNGNRLKIDICFSDAVTAERAMVLKNYLVDSLHFEKKDVRFFQESNLSKPDSVKKAEKDSLHAKLWYADTTFFRSEYMDISTPEIERLFPKMIYFNITDIRSRNASKWRILITDFLGKPVHNIQGVQSIQDMVSWDGFTKEGKLMNIGNFYYQFQYQKGDSRWIPKKPKRQRITFIKVKRSNIIEIRRKAINDFDLLKSIVIRLKNPIKVMENLNP